MRDTGRLAVLAIALGTAYGAAKIFGVSFALGAFFAGIVMAGSSDGGAHLASLVGADYTTRLLSEWVPDKIHLHSLCRIEIDLEGKDDKKLVDDFFHGF